MRRVHAILLLFVVALPALWLLLGSWSPDVLGSTGPPAPSSEPLGQSAGGASPGEPGAVGSNAGTVRAFAAPGPATLPTLEHDQVRIRVIDRKTRAPVPFAEIVAEAADAPSRRFAALSPADRRALHRLIDHFDKLARFGQTATADAEGRAVLRIGREHEVAARLDGRYGAITIQAPGEREVEVPIDEDVTLTVRVVDGVGKPLADVPIGLAVEVACEGAAAGEESTWLAAYSDADGEAVIRHLQDVERDQRRRQLRNLTAFVCAPGLESVRASGVPGPEPVLLRVRAHGSVRVEIEDREGHRSRDDFACALFTAGEQPEGRQFDGVRLSELSAAGVVLFPYVGVDGRMLVVSAGFVRYSSDPYYADGLKARCAGPLHDGETVVVRLAISPNEATELHGRLVDPDGAAIAGTDASLYLDRWLRGGTWVQDIWVGGPRLGTVETDADGRFRWLCRADQVPSGARLCVLTFCQGKLTGASDRIPLPAAAVRELGDVVIRGGRVVARGVVVADTPTLPVCDLRVDRFSDVSPVGEPPLPVPPVPPEPPDTLKLVQLADDDWPYVGTDANHPVDLRPDGSFTVLEFFPETPQRLQLYAWANHCLPVPPLEFRAGQENLRIDLRQGARLSVRVLVDAEFLDRSDDLRACLTGVGREPVQLFGELLDGAWLLERHGRPAGNYRLEASVSGHRVAVLDPLALQSGAVGDSAPPIDLRGRLASMQLRAVGDDGQVLDVQGKILMRDASGDWRRLKNCQLEHGIAQWLVPAGPVDLGVDISGMRSLLWSGRAGNVDLRIDPWTLAQVAIAGMPPESERVPVSVSIDPAPGWPTQRGLPEWVEALGDVEMKDAVVHFELGDAEDLVLRIWGGSTRPFAELPFHVTATHPRATVTLPAEVAAQLRKQEPPKDRK